MNTEISSTVQSLAKTFYTNGRCEKIYSQLFNKLAPILRRISSKVLKDRDEVEDNVSVTLTKLWERDFVWDDEKSFLNYAIMAAHRTALSTKKKNQYTVEEEIFEEVSQIKDGITIQTESISKIEKIRHTRTLQESKLTSSEDELPLEIVAHNYSYSSTINLSESENHKYTTSVLIVIDLIRSFPADQQEILMDAMIKQYNYLDIAKKYGLKTAGAVKTRVHRAKKKMMPILLKYPQFSKFRFDGSTMPEIHRNYYSDGALKMEREILADNLHGYCKLYHQNGTLKQVTVFTDGIKNGDYLEFYSNGLLKKRGNYKDGKKHGRWFTYSDEGYCEEMLEYEEGIKGYYELYSKFLGNGYAMVGIYGDTPKKSKQVVNVTNEILTASLYQEHIDKFSLESICSQA